MDIFPRLLDAPLTFEDQRGRVEVLYESKTAVLKRSRSQRNTLRGLHHQPSRAMQNKIIRVVTGRVIDFVADPNDKNEVVWWSEITAEDQWVFIDSKWAHGFYAVEDVVFEYFCDGPYSEEKEQSYLITDIIRRELQISQPILSEKDLSGQPFGKFLKHPNDKLVKG